MSTHPVTRRSHEPPFVLSFLGEFVYVVDLFVIGAVIAVAVIAGITPFDSPTMTGVTIVSLTIVALHQLWYRTHKDEIDKGPRRRHDRERRGF